MSLALPLRPEWLTHDRTIAETYANDPLVRRVTTARWIEEVDAAQRVVRAGAGALRTPTLMMLGESDPIAAPTVSREVFAALGSEDKTLKVYPGFLHEVLNESERRLVLTDLGAWLTARS
jgi:alpha-beta hydrolase superfamily lysophospholipase